MEITSADSTFVRTELWLVYCYCSFDSQEFDRKAFAETGQTLTQELLWVIIIMVIIMWFMSFVHITTS